MMSHLTPKKLVDKNGVLTTRNVRVDTPTKPLGIPMNPVVPAAPEPVVAVAAPVLSVSERLAKLEEIEAAEAAQFGEDGWNANGLHEDFGFPWDARGKLADGGSLKRLLKSHIAVVNDGDVKVSDIKPSISIDADGTPRCSYISSEFELSKQWIHDFRTNVIEELFEDLDPFEAMEEDDSTGELEVTYDIGEPALDGDLEDATDRSDEIEAAVQSAWTTITRGWNAPALQIENDALEEHGRYEMVAWDSRADSELFEELRNGFESEHAHQLKAVNKLVRKHDVPFEDAKKAVRAGLRGKAAASAFHNGIDFDLMNSVVAGGAE